MKRKVLYGLIFLVICSIFNLSLISAPRKLIYLDASNLPDGQLKNWPNLGVLGGRFVPVFNTQPTVEIVKGQKAVNLTAVDVLLRSTFSPPASLNGGRPFTLLVKAYLPELAQRWTILTWSQKMDKGAVFGVGKGREAAFYHSSGCKVGYQKGYPQPGLWHLLAFVYDKQTLRIYVDGWLKAEIEASLEISLDKYFYLGGQTVSGLPVPMDPFNGYLAWLELLDVAYSPIEIWNLAGHREAIPVYPEEGDVLAVLDLSLQWEQGDTKAASYAVYFSTQRGAVEKREKKAYRGKFPTVVKSLEVTSLQPGQSYFWRVDQLDSKEQIIQPGIVLSFKIDDGSAKKPVPHDHHGSVSRDLSRLKWTPGPWATSQDIYFSTDWKKLEKSRPLAKDLKPEANFFLIPEKLKYGQDYFWRIDTRNGSLPPSPGKVWSFRVQDQIDDDNMTFLVAADLHYGGSVRARDINRLMVETMNSIPGQEFPEEFGIKGKIRSPRGVIILGDIVDDGSSSEVQKFWQEYVEDFGLNGNGLLAFPVYEGFGENDGPSNGLVRSNIRNRNRQRPGLRSISADNHHYSWDWGQIHLVHLNIYPGSAGEEYLKIWRRRTTGDDRYPKQSLDFLIEDLRRNVGGSGRPVVIFQHYGFDSWSEAWWTQNERNAFLQAIRPYNVIAIFWGHSHVAQSYSWNGIKTWCAGTTNNDPELGTFLVVSLKTGRKNGRLIVATRKGHDWTAVEKVSFPMKKQLGNK